MKKYLLLILGFIFIIVAGCSVESIVGNGQLKTQTYVFDDFDALSISVPAHVLIKAGENYRVTITTDKNIFSYLYVDKQHRLLKIKKSHYVSLEPTHPIQIVVVTPVLNHLILNGDEVVIANQLNSQHFILHISGLSRCHLKGKINTFDLQLSGIAHILAKNLVTNDASIHISGVGHLILTVKNTLAMKISGVGYIQYYGDPRVVKQEISGSSRIIKG